MKDQKSGNNFAGTIAHIKGVMTHKFWVIFFMWQAAGKLIWRALLHDISKFEKSEFRGFAQVTIQLKHTTFNSKEYKDNLELIKPMVEKHYKRNPHHPQFYEDQIMGMNLYDLIEMFCDWKSSVKRHADGDIRKSIDINKDRFNMGEVTAKILHNTIDKDES